MFPKRESFNGQWSGEFPKGSSGHCRMLPQNNQWSGEFPKGSSGHCRMLPWNNLVASWTRVVQRPVAGRTLREFARPLAYRPTTGLPPGH